MSAFMKQQQPNVLFYVHHHGKGHLARAQHLVPLVEKYATVTLLTAHEDFADSVANALPKRKVITLPTKWPKGSGQPPRSFNAAFEGIPFAPQASTRAAFFHNLLTDVNYAGLISDVSAELTIYARGAGLPVLMQRHSGDISGDPTQVFAYHCASALYAPYPSQLEVDDFPFSSKTTFLGNLTPARKEKTVKRNGVTIVHNDCEVVNAVCDAILPTDMPITVISSDPSRLRHLNDIDYFRHVADISSHVETGLVFCSAGNNTLCELLAIDRKLIVVPEPRPYEEQSAKALKLANLNAAVYLPKSSISKTSDILNAIDQTRTIEPSVIASLLHDGAPSQWHHAFEILIREHFL